MQTLLVVLTIMALAALAIVLLLKVATWSEFHVPAAPAVADAGLDVRILSPEDRPLDDDIHIEPSTPDDDEVVVHLSDSDQPDDVDVRIVEDRAPDKPDS
jgi:hypothetical protein